MWRETAKVDWQMAHSVLSVSSNTLFEGGLKRSFSFSSIPAP